MTLLIQTTTLILNSRVPYTVTTNLTFAHAQSVMSLLHFNTWQVLTNFFFLLRDRSSPKALVYFLVLVFVFVFTLQITPAAAKFA